MPAFSQPTRVDHSKANVNGRRGFAVWPQVNGEAGDPAGYEVVLARRQQLESWLRFPAGKWQEVPAGEYWILLEGDFEVSPWSNLLHWSNGPYQGRGMADLKFVVAAGRLHLDAQCPDKECLGWMLHESSNVAPLGWFEPEMLRWSKLDVAKRDGVLMPVGRVAAALFDPVRKEFAAIQAPVHVVPRRSATVKLTAPANGRAALILEITRASEIQKPSAKDVQVALVAGGVTIQPGFVARTHQKIFAIWNDVPAGPARVDVSSDSVYLPQKDLHLRSTKVEHISVNLAPLPKLGVGWSIPDDFKPVEPTLKIVNFAGHETIKTVPLAKEKNQLELTVPVAKLEVTLKSGPWSLRQTVDFSDGADRSIQLDMHPFHVTGRVYCGNDPAKATITFRTDAEWKESLKVQTDPDGNYEALFAQARAYSATVDLEGRAAPYIVPEFDVEEDTTRDIHIPGNAYHFHVTRKDDGSPIDGARILIQNKENTQDGLVVVLPLMTDKLGMATAQPLRPGTFSVNVTKDGFVRLTRPEEAVVDNGQPQIDLSLEPVGATDTLTLLLPGGQPAAAANVMVHSDREDLTATTDATGHVAIPRADAGGVVLVRASGAALMARPWSGDDQTWTLDPSGEPLVIHAVGADGSDARAAPGILWLDGVRLSGGPLAWLTATAAGSDGSGYWVLRNLPARPLQVLLWRSTESNNQLVSQQRFDAMRTTIDVPWPATVDIKIIE